MDRQLGACTCQGLTEMLPPVLLPMRAAMGCLLPPDGVKYERSEIVGENAGITGDFSPFALEFILIRQSKHVDRPWLCCESNELVFE